MKGTRLGATRIPGLLVPLLLESACSDYSRYDRSRDDASTRTDAGGTGGIGAAVDEGGATGGAARFDERLDSGVKETLRDAGQDVSKPSADATPDSHQPQPVPTGDPPNAEGDAAPPAEEVSCANQGFTGGIHTASSHLAQLTLLAASLVNHGNHDGFFPANGDTSPNPRGPRYCEVGNDLLLGNCETDTPAGSLLQSTYGGADLCYGGSFQHLHFTHDYENALGQTTPVTSLGWIDTDSNTCLGARAAIVYATQRARSAYSSPDPTQRALAFYWAGHALHTIQESFAPSHTVRANDFHDVTRTCTFNLAYTPPSLCSVDVGPTGEAAFTDGVLDAAHLTDAGRAAVSASAGYLTALSSVLRDGADLDATLDHYFTYQGAPGSDLPSDTGYFTCATLETNRLPSVATLKDGTNTVAWTNLTPFVKNGVQYLLTYITGNGKVALYRIDTSNGTNTGAELLWQSGWTLGWTSFAPFAMNGVPYYLAYKSGTGDVVIDRIDGTAAVSQIKTVYKTTWSTGWTSFAPYDVSGVPHYIAYKKGTGLSAVDKIVLNGDQVEVVGVWPNTTGVTAPNLSQLHTFVLGTGRYAVGLDAVSGLAATYSMPGSTSLAANWSGTFDAGWDVSMPFTLGTKPYLMAYNSSSGMVTVQSFADPAKGLIVERTAKWEAGWSLLVPLTLPSGPTYYRYNARTGRLGMDTLCTAPSPDCP